MLRSRIATKSSLDALFRVFGAKTVLPELYYIRPLLLGSNFLDIREAFSRIHSWDDWVGSWESTGEKRETYARLARDERRMVTALDNYLYAAAAYHMAQFLLFEDIDRKRSLYRRCADCYAAAAPLLDPPAEPVTIACEGFGMAGYLRVPRAPRPAPLLILVCGADSAKEEMHFFSDGLLRRGVATLAFDGPGIGETWESAPLSVDVGETGRALFDFLGRDERIDRERIGLFGASFGGNQALRIAAGDDRVAAVIALSAPYDLSGYGEYVLPVIHDLVKFLLRTDSEDEVRRWADAISARGLVGAIEAPLLAIGGGEDLLIPGDDTKRIFEEARGEKKMIFFEEANHLCTEYAFDLVGKVEEWLIEIGFVKRDR